MVINNLVAANRPDLIRYQIQTNPEMEFLVLTDNQLTDIATYLAYPVTTDADCIFGWGEAVVSPNLLTPRTASQSAYGYYYRYYPPAQIYVATAQSAYDGTTHLYYLDAKSNQGILDLGDDSQYLSLALAAGCP